MEGAAEGQRGGAVQTNKSSPTPADEEELKMLNKRCGTGSRETGVLPVRSASLRKGRDWISPVSDEQLSSTRFTPIH
jgi:hypothetical protein